METFVPESLKVFLLGLVAIIFLLSRLAGALPNIGWLQIFRLPEIKRSEEQRVRQRRSANRLPGLQIVLAGLAFTPLYLISKLILFSEPKTTSMILVIASSVLFIGFGIWFFVRNL